MSVTVVYSSASLIPDNDSLAQMEHPSVESPVHFRKTTELPSFDDGSGRDRIAWQPP
jgi:hypothetical protein